MSYLDLPRFHFAGEFQSDPCTQNNSLGSCCGGPALPKDCSYDNTLDIDNLPETDDVEKARKEDLKGWNAFGTHSFNFRSCKVRSVTDSTGASRTTAAAEALVDATIESVPVAAPPGQPRPARLVDLDPAHQTSSQIWGLHIKIRTTAGEELTATMQTGTLRDLWGTRAPGGFARGMGGAYQSVLTDVVFTAAAGTAAKSAVLKDLGGRKRLSIKMVLYGYNATPGSTNFTVGKVVGTIGPVQEGEPTDYIPDRRLVHKATTNLKGMGGMSRGLYGTAPFKVDTKRKVLVLDLGNAIPESSPGTPKLLGPLTAEVTPRGQTKPVVLGTIPYTAAQYLLTAGIHEIPLDQPKLDALALSRLQLMDGTALALSERLLGVHVDVSETVVRLNPGETKDLELRVTQFGRKMPDARIFIDISKGAAGQGRAVTALTIKHGAGFTKTLVLGGVATADSNGHIKLRLVAGDPLHPRPHINGQLSFLGFYVHGNTVAHQRGEVIVRVYDQKTPPNAPTWADVEPLMVQYFRLYPSMRPWVRLNEEAHVKANKDVIRRLLRLPETHPAYMPVSRDISRDEKATLLKYLDSLP